MRRGHIVGSGPKHQPSSQKWLRTKEAGPEVTRRRSKTRYRQDTTQKQNLLLDHPGQGGRAEREQRVKNSCWTGTHWTHRRTGERLGANLSNADKMSILIQKVRRMMIPDTSVRQPWSETKWWHTWRDTSTFTRKEPHTDTTWHRDTTQTQYRDTTWHNATQRQHRDRTWQLDNTVTQRDRDNKETQHDTETTQRQNVTETTQRHNMTQKQNRDTTWQRQHRDTMWHRDNTETHHDRDNTETHHNTETKQRQPAARKDCPNLLYNKAKRPQSYTFRPRLQDSQYTWLEAPVYEIGSPVYWVIWLFTDMHTAAVFQFSWKCVPSLELHISKEKLVCFRWNMV